MLKTNNSITVTFTNIPDGILEGVRNLCDQNNATFKGEKVITAPDSNEFTIDTRFMQPLNRAEILAGIFAEYARAKSLGKLVEKYAPDLK